MKPCLSKRKLIAWLALGELDARCAQDLRAHIERCEGCRHYLAEMSAVGEKLAAAETTPEIEASESFHQGVVRRLRAEQLASPWEVLAARLNWRVALPALGAAAVVIVILSLLPRQPDLVKLVQVSLPLAAPAAPQSDLSPTVANYERAATRSLDELDELLTRQGQRRASPTPTYIASMLALVNAAD
jgi:anti-sigma factor RsiW